ncbi:MAG: hypothetical protein KIS94_14845 [Chitinophagales bacterium]|nr:hypothetical protein [Chitinophagales bacterium]
MNWKVLLIVPVWLVAAMGCKKNEGKNDLQIQLNYKIDNLPLKFDTLLYHCEAGYNYEVTRLHYYLSGFVFTMTDGTMYNHNQVYYVDARQVSTNTISLPSFPKGICNKLSFYIGIDSLKNKTDSLPATFDNINMGWPDAMGGGYHFVKLEGHYLDSAVSKGFAMHIGKNQFLVPVEINNPTITSGKLSLTMNINEWFRNPYLYDFKLHGSYSMNSDSAMQLLSANGKDVFD